jgi:ubiquinone/menaquinone biosynthesis C-methylase UbiE
MTIDPDEFRSEQRESWDSVAQGWRKWWRVFEASAQPLNERIVELAGVRPGMRVLDVATGVGEPALTAARRVGQGGHVLATDLAPQMLAVARERCRAEHLSNMGFLERDAQNLSLEAESFDAALSRWGLMLMLDPVAVGRGVHCALKPGGRFAAAVWGKPAEVPFLSIPTRIARDLLDLPPPPDGAPGPFSLCDEGRLEAVLEQAGFRDVEETLERVSFEFASAEEYVAFLADLSSTLRKTLAERTEADRSRVWNAVASEARAHARADGRVVLTNSVRCVRGSR